MLNCQQGILQMFVLFALQEFVQMWCKLKGKSQGHWAQLRRERIHYITRDGLPSWLSGKESACQCRRRGFDSWVRKIPWKRKWQPTPIFLPGKPMDRGAWWATVHGVSKRHDWATKQQPAMEEPSLCLRERKILLPPSPPLLCPVWKQGCCQKKKKKTRKASLIYMSYHWSSNVMRCMEERRPGAGWVTEEEEEKVWAEREGDWSDYRTLKMNDSYREW